MNELGYNQLVCDIFVNWENVKDELLITERKEGDGNGTIHVFIGAADEALRSEFQQYYEDVSNGENTQTGAIRIKHYFLRSNVVSMIGYLCQYYHKKGSDSTSEVENLLDSLDSIDERGELLSTFSYFKLSTGATKLRPYFKKFDADGVFTKVIRQVLLPNSAYKISLYKNSDNEYAAFWLLGFDNFSDFEVDSNSNYVKPASIIDASNLSLQQIFYGAPGTGKSYKVNQVLKESDSIRTTFHPDSDYSTFVGAYKPIIEPRPRYGLNQKETVSLKDATGNQLMEEVITYKFVPQAFIKAYLKAWKLMAEAKESGESPKLFYLVIEEINRGNCAQIFGDLFQLLDRSRNGFSSYEIVPDSDIQKFLKEDNELGFGKGLQVSDVVNDNGEIIATSDQIRNGEKLVLPPNLHIWATMNTSDQSLFPIDSAFKRRWEWKYIKISDAEKDWKIDINGTYYDWYKFIEQINKVISNMTSSADKQLGYFFCKAGKKVNETDAEPTIITAETFVGKVLFYLWNDVFKDYGFDNSELFKYNKIYDGKSVVSDLTFPDFYNDNNEVDVDTVKQFIDNILKWNSDENK